MQVSVQQKKLRGRISASKSDFTFDLVNILICGVILFAVAYPLYFVLIASFSDPDMIKRGEVILLPKGISLDAYREVFSHAKIWTGYFNTVIYTTGATIFALLFTLPAAYAVSRRDFVLRKPIMVFFLIAMFFNGGLIPTYIQIQRLGMLDTYWAMVIPFSVNIYNLIVSRTFFASTIPAELREAAEIDGCTNTRFFVQIVLPLSKAIVAVIALYVAVSSWNSYMNALLYIQSPDKKPLQLVLRDILISNQLSTDSAIEAIRKAEMLKYALIVVSTLPIMCVYPFIQKHFAKGVMIGSVKG